jgi:hypothetical protein
MFQVLARFQLINVDRTKLTSPVGKFFLGDSIGWICSRCLYDVPLAELLFEV